MKKKITLLVFLVSITNTFSQNLNFINKADKIIARSASTSAKEFGTENIYISNGFSSIDQCTSEIEKYNPISNNWSLFNTSIPSIKKKFGNSEITLGYLCLFNGLNNAGSINDKFEKIDLNDGYLLVSDILNPNPVYGAGSEFYNQYLLSFGGCSDTFNANFSKKFYQISINPETFTQLADMPVGLQAKGKILLNNSNQTLYVFGGYKETNNSTENFETTTPNTNLLLADWINVAETGTKLFKAKQFTTNKYAEISAFESSIANQEPSNINWLISNQLTALSTQEVFLNFNTKDGFDNGATLQAYLITNWTGDISTSTKSLLNAEIANGTLSGYANNFKNSGNILLTGNLSNFRIGFKYIGGYSQLKTTTFQIDNVRIFKTTISDNIYKYNFVLNTWTTINTILPQSLSAYAIAKSSDTKVYITGDYNNQTFTGIFDSQNETFTSLTQTNMIGRRHHNSEFWNNKLLIFGGNTSTSTSSVLASTQSTDLPNLDSEEFQLNSEFVIHPNPATEFININNEIENVSIYTIEGKQIEIQKNGNIINISKLNSGIYLLFGENKNGKSFKTKLIKK